MPRTGIIDCFDIDGCRVRMGVTDTPASLAYGQVLDAPGIMEMSLEPEMLSSQSYGNARVLDHFARLKQVVGTVAQAHLSHELFAKIFAGHSTSSGSSPNEQLVTGFGPSNIPWFELDFFCKYAGPFASLAGDAHVIIHKARVSKLTYAKKMESRHEVGFEFVGIPLFHQEAGWPFPRCFSFVENETHTAPAVSAADNTPPTLDNSTPANEATSVAVGASIVLTFSEALDPVTVNEGNFILATAAGVIVPINTPSLNSAGTVVTVKSTSNLSASTEYRWTVTRGVRDRAGNRLAANQTGTFTTA